MRRFQLARLPSRAGIVAITLVAGAGCRTWAPVSTSVPIARAITDAPGGAIRLSTPSFDRVTLHNVRVEGDSVVGRLASPDAAADSRVAVALADVMAVEERRVSVRRTAFAVVGDTLGVLAILALLIASSDGISLGS